MISATDLKSGVSFSLDGKPYLVLKYFQQKMGRGRGIVKLSLRNLLTGASEEKTFNSTLKVEEIKTQKKKLQYLYKDNQEAVFMDPTNYEQISIPLEVVGDQLAFIQEGNSIDILFWGDKPLSVDLPPKVTLTVLETSPGVKGNTASNVYKPAELENGLEVKVPLFIKKGDRVRVDTRTGEYVERAK